MLRKITLARRLYRFAARSEAVWAYRRLLLVDQLCAAFLTRALARGSRKPFVRTKQTVGVLDVDRLIMRLRSPECAEKAQKATVWSAQLPDEPHSARVCVDEGLTSVPVNLRQNSGSRLKGPVPCPLLFALAGSADPLDARLADWDSVQAPRHAEEHLPVHLSDEPADRVDDEDADEPSAKQPLLVHREAPQHRSSTTVRQQDGAWSVGAGEVAGVLTGTAILPWTVAQVPPTLWLNPKTPPPVGERLYMLRRVEFTDAGEPATHEASISIAELLELSPEWPGDVWATLG